jgi:hypothetical protein
MPIVGGKASCKRCVAACSRYVEALRFRDSCGRGLFVLTLISSNPLAGLRVLRLLDVASGHRQSDRTSRGCVVMVPLVMIIPVGEFANDKVCNHRFALNPHTNGLGSWA